MTISSNKVMKIGCPAENQKKNKPTTINFVHTIFVLFFVIVLSFLRLVPMLVLGHDRARKFSDTSTMRFFIYRVNLIALY